ncbi:MAG: 3-deoxy-manno-octulosonate cytidylyltransferase, partial [Rhodospirillaceae bacterium]|nr:3-deoxy-manno-octulosonate cytidylyltransferase [Rhodospirillaceae bacterium]
MKVTAIIPARMGSSRFPGKPIAPLLGRPTIEHVYK